MHADRAREVAELKAKAIDLGEAAGEAAALALYQERGISALAATLRPPAWERHSQAFYARWQGGPETWQEQAFVAGLAAKAGVTMVEVGGYDDPRCLRAFDEVYARGARKVAELIVWGYLDALEGKPCKRDQAQRLGDRPALPKAYETGHALGVKEVSRG